MKQPFISKKKASHTDAVIRLVITLCFPLLTGTGALGQGQNTSAIRAVMDAQQAAWNHGDIEGFMNGYARSSTTTFVSGDTLTRGWETVRNRYQRKYASREQMGQLTFSEVQITPLCSDAAIVLGRWQLKRKTNHPHGRFSLLFRHGPEGWRIVHDHTSAASPQG